MAPFLYGEKTMNLIRVLCLIVCATMVPHVQANSDAETQLVYKAVKDKYPDPAVLCKQNEDQLRAAIVQVIMPLMSQRKLQDPMTAGPQAGALLRKECGGVAATNNDFRWISISPKSLSFSAERNEISVFTSHHSLANKVFTPKGDGPFPAVVLSHTSGGLQAHMLDQAKFLIDAGFAVLTVDTWGSRNFSMSNESHPAESVRDAYDGLRHLNQLPFIDKTRIYQTGFSLGAFAAALLTSPEGAKAFKSDLRFRATVGHYGTCWVGSRYNPRAASGTVIKLLEEDMDKPLLMLMGGRDIESPPENCFPLLDKLKAAGKPIEWKIYPNATHGWDKQASSPIFRTSTGETMTYQYNAQVTKEATEQMIAFFNKYR